MTTPIPDFSVSVPPSGYRWWYVDGISDDGRQGIVVIAFVGSVFSPYYYRARQRGPADPEEYCAVNVGLYQRRGKRWCMTERNKSALSRTSGQFSVGPSRLYRVGDQLQIDIRERSAPFGLAVEGSISITPRFTSEKKFWLDPAQRHGWQPIAPLGRIDVVMNAPQCRWSGSAYLDTNWGSRALEDDFLGWNWTRRAADDRAVLTYAADLRTGESRTLALKFDASGSIDEVESAPAVRLPGTGWRVGRETRANYRPAVIRTLEDTPFYARSMITAESADAEPVMHESLSLERFRAAWVRALLPFRMPRRKG